MKRNGTIDPRSLALQPGLETPLSTPLETETVPSESTSQSDHPRQRKTPLPTGVCYDGRMKLHANADFSANPQHPEDPARIEAIFNEFKLADLVYTGKNDDKWLKEQLKINPNKYMWRIPARLATKEEVCLCHLPVAYEWAKGLNAMSSIQLRDMTLTMDLGRKSLYVGNLTFEAALLSVGGAIETCKRVVRGECKNAFAVIRPPGHHAEPHESMGFCIFNNVPIAAKVCMADYPESCRKVLILDWDVHHGNGIQNMFYEDPNVLYISLHVYQDGEFYPGPPDMPGVEDGGVTSVGAGLGIGRNVNIGWHSQGMGDGEYLAAFHRIVMPIAHEFDPDLVIISAGFDAAAGDELGGCYVTPACYAHMTHMLMSLAEGKVAVCLEGGYNLAAISVSALAVAKTLMGEAPPKSDTFQPLNEGADAVLREVKKHHAAYWSCMRDPGMPITKARDEKGPSIGDAIQSQRRETLWKYKMTKVSIVREFIGHTFNNQILQTPDLNDAEKLVVIIHSPAPIYSHTDRVGRFVPERSIVPDPVTPYIDKFRSLQYAVCDINIPKHLPPSLSGVPINTPTLEQQTRDVMGYLWDNYFELRPRSIVLLALGSAAHKAIRNLLVSRPIVVRDRVSCILSFLPAEHELRRMDWSNDDGLEHWWKRHTRTYVQEGNEAWEKWDEKKLRRHGPLFKENEGSFEEAIAWCEEQADATLDRARDIASSGT
ncbi:histone deacetylase [Bisporella sp. PMI_857]|nr:histone deacetylase [Bisporella sp. PMI_857]